MTTSYGPSFAHRWKDAFCAHIGWALIRTSALVGACWIPALFAAGGAA